MHEFLELLKCVRTLNGLQAIQAYEAALALYAGDLFDTPDMPTRPWLYDGARIALTLRVDYERMQREARLHLADLLAAGPAEGLPRAAELYVSLCGEEPDEERPWISLFRVYDRAANLLGLQSAEKKLRAAIAEATGDAVADLETVEIPPKLKALLDDIRAGLSAPPTAPAPVM